MSMSSSSSSRTLDERSVIIGKPISGSVMAGATFLIPAINQWNTDTDDTVWPMSRPTVTAPLLIPTRDTRRILSHNTTDGELTRYDAIAYHYQVRFSPPSTWSYKDGVYLHSEALRSKFPETSARAVSCLSYPTKYDVREQCRRSIRGVRSGCVLVVCGAKKIAYTKNILCEQRKRDA